MVESSAGNELFTPLGIGSDRVLTQCLDECMAAVSNFAEAMLKMMDSDIAKAGDEAGEALQRLEVGGVELGNTIERIQAAFVELSSKMEDAHKELSSKSRRR